MAFDQTKGAVEHMQDDARVETREIRDVAVDFFGTVADRLGIVGDDARALIDDGSIYMRHWAQMVRDDLSADLKKTVTNALTGMTALFLGILGFALVNAGLIWIFSDFQSDVGNWFLGFGLAWIVVAGALGLIAYTRENRALRDVRTKVSTDARLPTQHARELYQRYQEKQNESPRARGNA